MKVKIPKFVWIFLCAVFLTLCVVFVTTLPDLELKNSPAVLNAKDMELLDRTYVKPVDIHDVRQRIWHATASTERTSPCSRTSVGDVLSFSVANGKIQPFQVDAKLFYSDNRISLWVANDVPYSDMQFLPVITKYEKASMSVLQPLNYPQMIAPVIGNTSVLLTHGLGHGVAGYYSPINEYPKDLAAGSNECGMVFMNADEPGIYDDLGVYTLSHELSHRYLWLSDPNEFLWVNEGLADLFSLRVGNYNRNDVVAFQNDTNISWTVLDSESYESGAAGASLSFFAYLRSVYGENFLVDLTKIPSNGFVGVEDNLRNRSQFEDILLGWAEYVWTHGLNSEAEESPDAFWSRPALTSSMSCDRQVEGKAYQHGIVYVGVDCPGPTSLSFDGAKNVSAFPAYMDRRFVMWSNRGNLIDTSMTKQFDFTNHSGSLTLSYLARYNSSSADHLYPLYSYDNINWLSLNQLQDKDAIMGLWGQSNNEWVPESVDISSLSGKKVWIRFEYVSGVTGVASGFYISDITIKEVNYTSEYKEGLDGWATNGFVRVPERLPQIWRAALIQRMPDGKFAIRTIDVESDNSFRIEIESQPDSETVLVLMAMTPYTHAAADFSLSLEKR